MRFFYRQCLLGGMAACFFIVLPGPAAGAGKVLPTQAPAVKAAPRSRPGAAVKQALIGDGPGSGKLNPIAKSQPIVPVTVNIPAGCFQMGSPEAEAGRGMDEKLHRVCVKSFKLGKNEVTVEEFSLFAEATGFKTDADNNTLEPGCWSYEKKQAHAWDWRAGANWKKPIQGSYPLKNYPVTCVSYRDVTAYIDWLNETTGHRYRLPTEAEWEYAARAGTSTAHFWGNNADIACGYANVADETPSGPFKWPEAHACEDGHFFTAAVRSFAANPFNLHDMLGNAWEWTCSPYRENYNGDEQKCLPHQAEPFPAEPSRAEPSLTKLQPFPAEPSRAEPSLADDILIVIRGGGWNANAERVRSAHRNWGVAWSRQANLGFRLVRER